MAMKPGTRSAHAPYLRSHALVWPNTFSICSGGGRASGVANGAMPVCCAGGVACSGEGVVMVGTGAQRLHSIPSLAVAPHRIVIWRVGRQELDDGAGGLDQPHKSRVLVDLAVVQHQHAVRLGKGAQVGHLQEWRGAERGGVFASQLPAAAPTRALQQLPPSPACHPPDSAWRTGPCRQSWRRLGWSTSPACRALTSRQLWCSAGLAGTTHGCGCGGREVPSRGSAGGGGGPAGNCRGSGRGRAARLWVGGQRAAAGGQPLHWPPQHRPSTHMRLHAPGTAPAPTLDTSSIHTNCGQRYMARMRWRKMVRWTRLASRARVLSCGRVSGGVRVAGCWARSTDRHSCGRAVVHPPCTWLGAETSAPRPHTAPSCWSSPAA